VAVSLCSIIEGQLRVPIVTFVGSQQQLIIIEGKWARSTITCWGLPVLVAPTLLVGCFGKFGERTNPLTAIISAGGWVVVLAACLLTQWRTLLVGLVVGVIVLWILDRDPKRRTWLLLTLLTIPLWIGAGALLGERFLGKGFSEYYLKRYGVMKGVSEAIEYAPSDGRTWQYEAALQNTDEWLWFGVGFAGTYGDPSGEWWQTGGADSNLLYFAVRFGVLGILLLGWFILINIRLARGSPQSDLHKSIAAGLLSLIACSFFGDVFASSYVTPVAMTAFSLLLASVATRTRVLLVLSAPGAEMRTPDHGSSSGVGRPRKRFPTQATDRYLWPRQGSTQSGHGDVIPTKGEA
jgi:O-antigen ligase